MTTPPPARPPVSYVYKRQAPHWTPYSRPGSYATSG